MWQRIREAADSITKEFGQAAVPIWKVVENGLTKKIVVGYDINALEAEFT